MWLKLSGNLVNMDLVETIIAGPDNKGCFLNYGNGYQDGCAIPKNGLSVDESIEQVKEMLQTG